MAMILVLAVISVPWGWYARSKAAKLTNDATSTPNQSTQSAPTASESVAPTTNLSQPSGASSTSTDQPAKSEPGDQERAKDKK
jgi:hypothetical protein